MQQISSRIVDVDRQWHGPTPASYAIAILMAVVFVANASAQPEPSRRNGEAINTEVEAGQGSEKVRLTLVDLESCFLPPKTKSNLQWRVEGPENSRELPYIIRDYAGEQLTKDSVTIQADRTVTITRPFDRGFHEVQFPESHQTFGIVVLEQFKGTVDPFFCMDSGLSWLVKNEDSHAPFVKILSRCGVSMGRERIGMTFTDLGADGFKWELRGKNAPLRKSFSEGGLSILELEMGNPQILGKHARLTDFSQSWINAARQPHLVRGGIEADNEPDLRTVPAEQYVPFVKTVSYSMNQVQLDIPLVAGAFGHIPPGPFFDACLANGMIDDADAISFHSYLKAKETESVVQRFRQWLSVAGKPAMPLWHTECGWSWVKGPERPPLDQDGMSALEISAKAVESKACGVARYFPFVYTYYEEGNKNFGMMGRDGSPLRSMAAYAFCIRELSNLDYIGDVRLNAREVVFARVFREPRNKDCVVVIYSDHGAAQFKIALPFAVQRVKGADGRALKQIGRDVPLPDGMSYVWSSYANLKPYLKTNTVAMELFQLGKAETGYKRNASPIVLEFLSSQTPAKTFPSRYRISKESAKALPIHVRATNLSDKPISVTPKLKLSDDKSVLVSSAIIPEHGHHDFHWTLDASNVLDIVQTKFITITAQSDSDRQPSPLAIPFLMDSTLEEQLARSKSHRELPITNVSQWKANASDSNALHFSVTGESTLKMTASFSHEHGNWCYPRFVLDEKIDSKKFSGFVVRARISRDARNIAMIAEVDHHPQLWSNDLFPADGNWHTVFVPFDEFHPTAGNQNDPVDPTKWKSICIGMGMKERQNELEISHIVLVET